MNWNYDDRTEGKPGCDGIKKVNTREINEMVLDKKIL